MKATLVGGLLYGMSSSPLTAKVAKTTNVSLKKPKRLVAGNTIGLIAPATNAWENEDIRFAMDIITSLGFKVKPGKHLFDRRGYLAGRDADRAADVNRMFADPNIDGIFCLRGGWGTPRILPLLDYDLIAKNPKLIMGYSDITALLNAIHVKTGLITFHGPIARQTYSDYTLAEFRKVTSGESTFPQTIGSAPPFEISPGKVEREHRITTIVKGQASGQLVGGNLTLFTDLQGTPFAPDLKGKILFLEDVNEEPYRIDAMLTQLWLSGQLEQCAGIVLAKFTDCKAKNPPSVPLEEIFFERIQPLGVPCYRGLLSGHVTDQTVVPIGSEARMDADKGVLQLTEPAVF
jgi:muramoyltetrapeptide carboxypeptidase